MLSSFFIQNFRSILELRLDFTYGEGKAPNGYLDQETMPFLDAPQKKRLVPCTAFFGANASGKTNILLAFHALNRLVRDGGPLAEIYEPNLINPKFSSSTFIVEFGVGEDCYKYSVTFNAKEILEESLQKNAKPLFQVQTLKAEFSRQILSATYSQEKLSDILRVECSDGEGRQTKSFLHRIGLGYPGLHSDLKNAFGYFLTGLHFFPNNGHLLLPVAVDVLASAMDGDRTAALCEIADVVRRLDIDITGLQIDETPLGPDEAPLQGSILRQEHPTGVRRSIQITAMHQDTTGQPVPLDFLKHESAGTQRLAGLVGLILFALKTGSVLLVDELECSLHPLLMREIVMLFKKRSHNPKGAQLIFTTHNTDILDDSILRLSEIALVRKTPANGTLVRRLVDAKREGEDIRNVTNFRKQYLAGFYAGIPHPAL